MDALFNRPTWDGRNVKALIAKGTRTMSAAFTFSVDDDENSRMRRIIANLTLENDAMRQLNTYVQADAAAKLGELDELSLTELIIETGIHDAIARK